MSSNKQICAKAKLEIINFFENEIINEIDIRAQTLLLPLDNKLSRKKIICTALEQSRKKILETNQLFINEVEQIYKKCLEQLSDKVIVKSSDELKRVLIKNFAYFYPFTKINGDLGVLVLTDWFLDSIQIDYLK